MKKKWIIVTGSLLIIILLTSISVFYILPKYQSHDDGYLTVEEFNDLKTTYESSESNDFQAGMVYKIKDRVHSVRVFQVPEYELTSIKWEDFLFNRPTGEWLTFTEVTFNNNETLNFIGNRTSEFIVGESVTFNLPIKQYSSVPEVTYLPELTIAFSECHYNQYYIQYVNHVRLRAKFDAECQLGLELNKMSDDQATIIFTSYSNADLKETLFHRGTKMELVIDDVKIDELNNTGESNNGLFTFYPSDVPTWVGNYQYQDYWTGNKITVKSILPGIQKYELVIRSRCMYPEPGYENGYIIGNVTWEM